MKSKVYFHVKGIYTYYSSGDLEYVIDIKLDTLDKALEYIAWHQNAEWKELEIVSYKEIDRLDRDSVNMLVKFYRVANEDKG